MLVSRLAVGLVVKKAVLLVVQTVGWSADEMVLTVAVLSAYYLVDKLAAKKADLLAALTVMWTVLKLVEGLE